MEESYSNYFAEIYDDVMKRVPYEFWFKYLKDILKFYNLEAENILELAAGTGNMTRELIKLDSVKKVTALDLSESMLEKAVQKTDLLSALNKKFSITKSEDNDKHFYIKDLKREKEIELDFTASDMRNYSFQSKYDLILSFFDSLNYLTDKKGLKKCFLNTAQALKDNGLFIFDMNSIERIHSIEERRIVLEGEDYSCFWEDITKEEEDLWLVRLQICPDSSEIPCYEELHTERGYKISVIKELLLQSGFKAVDVYRAFSLDRGSNKSDRLYFVAALNKERLKNNQGKIKKIYYSFKNDILYLYYSLKYSFFTPEKNK